jgi:hypothetical protein
VRYHLQRSGFLGVWILDGRQNRADHPAIVEPRNTRNIRNGLHFRVFRVFRGSLHLFCHRMKTREHFNHSDNILT